MKKLKKFHIELQKIVCNLTQDEMSAGALQRK